MTRRQKDPLRPRTPEERTALAPRSRAPRAPASHVARARRVLAVADGQRYTTAARGVGRRSGDAVARLVARFTTAGRAAIAPGHGGGAAVAYEEAKRARIRAEVRRAPDRDADGTATWSRSTRRRAPRQAPDGLPGVREDTIWGVLRGAGRRWQRERRRCETGVVARQRKGGPVVVADPDAAPQKSRSRTPTDAARPPGWRSGRGMRRGRSKRCRIPAGTGARRGGPPTSRTSTRAPGPPSGCRCPTPPAVRCGSRG